VTGARAGVAGVYNRYSYRAEKAYALARWATKVATFTADQDKVI